MINEQEYKQAREAVHDFEYEQAKEAVRVLERWFRMPLSLFEISTALMLQQGLFDWAKRSAANRVGREERRR